MQSKLMDETRTKKIEFVVLALIFAITAAKKILINVHIDEEVVVAMGYRGVIGNSYFKENQEPQLLLGPLLSLPIKLFMVIFKSTDYVFIYMKVIMILILGMCALLTYLIIKVKVGHKEAFVATAVVLLYHFRGPNVTDYTFMYDIAGTVSGLFCISLKNNRLHLKNILVGITFSIMVLCFPVVIVLFPLYCLVYMQEDKKSAKINLIETVCVCAIAGLMECIVLLKDIEFGQIISTIQNVISSSTYGKKNINLSLLVLEVIAVVLCMPLTNIQQRMQDLIVLKVEKKLALMWGGMR